MPTYSHTTYNPRSFGAAGNGHAAAAAAAYAHPSLLSRNGAVGNAAASSAAASIPSRPSFHVGMRVDARDGPGKWLPACIVHIEDRGPMGQGRSGDRSAAGRSPLLPPKSSASQWELDQTGSWQPRGGRVMLVHFDGFSDKWDEYIHEASFVPDTSPKAIAALDEAMRPRLAPLGLLTKPSMQHQRSISNGGTTRKYRSYVLNEKVSVLVHRPTDSSDDSSFLSTLGLNSAAAAAASAGAPRFTASWFQAIVIDVDGDQIQIKYSPRQTNTNAFTFPVWFHHRLGEVKRFGASAGEEDEAASPLSPTASSTPLSPSAVAAANRANAGGVLNGVSDGSVTPDDSSLLSSFKSMFTRSPSAPHTPGTAAAAASPGAARPAAPAAIASAAAPATARAATLPSTPSAAPAAAAAPALAASPAAALARANISRAAAVPPVTSTPPASTRNHLATTPAAASAAASSAAAASSPAAPSPSAALSLRSRGESPYAALLRASAKAPLRAPVGIINLGNSCQFQRACVAFAAQRRRRSSGFCLRSLF